MNDYKSETTMKEFVPWEKYHETIFIDWADKASCYNWLHNKSYLKYSRKRNLFTVPVIIMSTLTGTANFALDRIPEDYKNIFTLSVGSVNILAGIITTVAQFLKLNELTESHRVASISWDKFYRSIRLELIKAPEERVDCSYFMKTSRDEFDRLMETSPGIDKDIISTFKQELTNGKNKEESNRKLKNFNRLIKPEIFNELYTLKEVVYKAPPQIEIQIEDLEKIKRLENERDNYRHNLDSLRSFIENFKSKYSRHPSHDEFISNLPHIKIPDLKILLNDINFAEK